MRTDGFFAAPRPFVFAQHHAGVNHHARSKRRAICPRAVAGHKARHIRPTDVRLGQIQPRPPLAHPQVEVIERHGFHLHQCFTWPWLGVSHIAVLHHLRAAVLVKVQCFHRCNRCRSSETGHALTVGMPDSKKLFLVNARATSPARALARH